MSPSPQLTYPPAYVGLYLALVLAVTCNAFLDIRYGTFSAEVLVWAIVFGVTLWVGWRQRGNPAEPGRKWQKWTLFVGVLSSLVIFMPMWGLPRAGIYMLAALQASYNCVTTTRRHLYLGVVVATVIAIFAAAHSRADWTMLFYLVPFVVVVVFTLVAEQINRHAEDLRVRSLGGHIVDSQGIAIVAASSVILSLGAVLYAVTPQISWTRLTSLYGLETGAGAGEAAGGSNEGPAGAGGGGAGTGTTASRTAPYAGGGLTPDAMRQSAKAPGMPRWQAGMINALADISESIEKVLSPAKTAIADLWEALKEWLREHWRELVATISLLVLLVLLGALWILAWEARVGAWLTTRVDYLRYVLLGWHAQSRAGAVQLYVAMERLFALQDQPRERAVNAREYLAQLCNARKDLRSELSEMTSLFEGARYGPASPGAEQLSRMCSIYRKLFASSS